MQVQQELITTKEAVIKKAKAKNTNKKEYCNQKKGKASNKSSEIAELVRGLPQQSIFCSQCHTPGHNITTCGGVGNPPIKRKSTGKGKKMQEVICCNRCVLTGPNDGE